MGNIYVGDEIAIVLDATVDVSAATGCVILVLDPMGNAKSWTATPSGTTLTYVTSAADLPVPGKYRLHAQFDLGGATRLGEETSITVHELFGGVA
jgi:hypothetical protein